MNIKKKIITFILAFAIVLTLVPTLNVQAKTNDAIISNEAPNPGKPENKPIAPSIVENISQSNKKLEDDKPNITSTIGWKNKDKDWYYYKSDNTKAIGWIKPNSNWYYLKDDGKMEIGWLYDIGAWYYLDKSGAMSKGWKQVNDVWYFLNDSGSMVTGINKIDNKNYMFNDSGAMEIGWVKLNNYWYYFNTDGSMATGWIGDNGKKYYLYDTGAMAKGWIELNGEWYYLNDSGVMLTGWIDSGSDSYYLEPSTGKMATNTKIDDYNIGTNGKKTIAVDLKKNNSDDNVIKNSKFKGIDVSNYDGNIDFTKVKEDGVECVYMKATEGTTFIDKYLETNYKGAKGAVLKTGFYHFLVGTSSPEAQAENFYNNIKNKESDLKPCLDIETAGFDVMDYTLRFIDEFKKLSNMDICIYTYSGFISKLDNRLSSYTLWEANFNNKPFNLPSNNIWSSRAGHQFTDKGNISGINCNVDLDEFTQDILR